MILRTELNRTFPCDPAIASLRIRSIGLKTNVRIKARLQTFTAALLIPSYPVSNQTQSGDTYEQRNAIQGANRQQKDTKGASVWNLEQMKPVWKVWSLCDPNRRTAKKSPYMEKKNEQLSQGIGSGGGEGEWVGHQGTSRMRTLLYMALSWWKMIGHECWTLSRLQAVALSNVC